jgi:hypothetical protein
MIPTRVHALMDYTVGVLLIAAPWIFQFADESNAAKWISVIAGVATIGLSAMTDYEGGFLTRAIPMRMHLATDALVGVVLIASPWLFGFADQGLNAWLPFVAIGVGELGAAAMTSPVPDTARARGRQARSAT